MTNSGGWLGIGALGLVAAACVPEEPRLVSQAPVAAAPLPEVAADSVTSALVVPAALEVLPGPAFNGLPATVVAADGMEAVILATGDGATDLVLVAPGMPAGAGSCGQLALDAYALAVNAPPDNIQVHFVFPQPDTPDETILALTTALTSDGIPAGVVNLGACDGTEGVAVWDADGPAERSLVMDALIQAGDSEGVAAGFAARPVAAPTHHRAFQAAGVPAVGLTLPTGDDAQSTRLLVRVVDVFDAFVGRTAPQ